LLQKLKTRLATLSGDKKSVLSLVGGTTIAQGLSFLFSPIQTRLFSPEVFGELSVFTSITGIVGGVVCLEYELAIVLPKDDDEGFALLKLSWFFAALVALASLVVFGLWGRQIYARFNAPGLAKYWYYVPITLLLTGVIQAANYWLTRQRKFTVLSYNKVLPVLAVNLVSIGLGLAGDRALGARLFSSLVSQLVNLAVLATALVPDSRVVGRTQFGKAELISKYRSFILYGIWGVLINNLSWMIVPILMNAFYGSFAAGQYSIGMRVIQVPMSLIGASISQVFMKTASEKKHQAILYSYALSIIKKVLFYTAPLLILIAFGGRQVFRIIFGIKWDMAGLYSQILAPWALVWFCAATIGNLFSITQKQNWFLIIAILNIATRVLSLKLGTLFRSDIIGIVFFSISGVITYGLSMVLALKAARKSDENEKDRLIQQNNF
jgi:O-antigen/teichoic acid export membrane protein